MNQIKGIPVHHYFDKDIYQKEMEIFFKNTSQYIGAASMLKNEGDFRVVERLGDSKILTRKNGKIHLLENICSHRQARMISGSGNSPTITCPLHCWGYDGEGNCKSTPMFDGPKELYSLKKSEFENWNNLLFSGERSFTKDIKSFPYAKEMELDKMVYTKTFTEHLDFNWKNYIDGFAEDYHVPFVHPGFAGFVDLKSIQWVDDKLYTGQLFKLKEREFLETHKTTPKYQRWIKEFLNYYPEKLPDFGGILIMYYPNVMIEWYPLFMAISTVHPTGPESCVNHIDFFHHQDVINNHPELRDSAEEAYIETADEDALMCKQLAQGRKDLFMAGENEMGPYQHPYEDGLEIFHRFYNEKMKL